MVQKQRQKGSDSSVDELKDGLSDKLSGSSTASDGTLSRLYNAISKEGNTKDGAVAGTVTGILGLVVSGIVPFTILPMLLGFAIGGSILGGLSDINVHSLIGGVAVSSFLTFFLFVNIPILGLGLISTVLFTIVATGATVATYEKSK